MSTGDATSGLVIIVLVQVCGWASSATVARLICLPGPVYALAMSSARYVGGPFDGGSNPDTSIDEIKMRSPAGCGRYVLGMDENGVAAYRWEPDQDCGGQQPR
jgi:hypothetical protein